MFGKPEWFRRKRWGWGLEPVTLAGWLYTAVWVAVMVAPYLLLLVAGRWPEAFLWLGATIALLLWDVWQIMRAMPPATKPAESEHVAPS